MLQARAHFLPWILLAVAVGFGVAGTRREPSVAGPAGEQADSAEAPAVAVRCDLRNGFVLRLAMHAQLLARSVVAGGGQARHTHGATCLVHQDHP